MPDKQKAEQKNYEGAPSKPAGGSTLLGVLLGLGLGLLIASVVAYFVYQKGTPFKTLDNPNPPTAAPLKAPEPTAAAKSGAEGKIAFPNTSSTQPSALPPLAQPAAQNAAPAVAKEPVKEVVKESAKEIKAAKAAAAQKEEPATGTETAGKPLFLQAGAFSNKSDAETRKAALALVGLEAKITEIMKDEKPVYRVRVGPFSSPEDATKARGDMARNGIDSVLVK